jgi:hypothetical protein
MDNGSTVDLTLVGGNITSSQMSNVIIATNQSAATTTVSFTVTGQSGTTGFCNMTIPKSAVANGTVPAIYVDGQPASNQSYAQDSSNYYVWYATEFSIHQVSIVFMTTPTNTQSPSPTSTVTPSISEFPSWILPSIFLVSAFAAVTVARKKKQTGRCL